MALHSYAYTRVIKIIKINLKERNPLSSWSNEFSIRDLLGLEDSLIKEFKNGSRRKLGDSFINGLHGIGQL